MADNPINQTRQEAADALRKAAALADDAGDYGADLAKTGIDMAVSVGKGFIRIPTSFVADLLATDDEEED